MNTETKVGILFFLGIGVAIWFTLFVTDSVEIEDAYRIAFDETLGLDTGSNVTYNGVRIGRVRQVVPELELNRPVVAVYFDIHEDTENVLVGEKTRFTVAQGLFGGASLAILSPGLGDAIDRVNLKDFKGESPVTLNHAIEQFHDLIEENRASVKSAMDKMPTAVDNFSGMSAEIQGLVKENRANVGEMVVGVKELVIRLREQVDQYSTLVGQMMNNIDGMAVQIRDMVVENRPDVRTAVKQIPETVTNLKNSAGTAAEILTENREGIRTIVRNAAEALPKVNAIATDVQKVSAQIASGEGSIGKLVFDQELYDRGLVVVDNANQRLEEIEPFTSNISSLKFFLHAESTYNTSLERLNSKFMVRIEPRPWKFYEGGLGFRGARKGLDEDDVSNEPEDFDVDFHLALGWRFLRSEEMQRYLLSVKGGILEGAIGAQADAIIFTPDLRLSLLLRQRHDDFEETDRRFEEGDGIWANLHLRYDLGYNIYAIAGAEDLFDSPGFFGGLGVEFLDMDIRNLATAAAVAP